MLGLRAVEREAAGAPGSDSPAGGADLVAEAPPATVLAMAAVGAAAVAQGAYHLTGQVLTGALLAGAVVIAAAGRRLRAADLRFAPVPACAALAVWACISVAAAGVPMSAAGPTVALLGASVAVAVLCRQGRGDVVTGLLLVGGLVSLSGLAGVALRYEPWTLEDQGLWRAATTLTYANAGAGLLVALALLAVGRLAAGGRRSPSMAMTACLLLAGAGATASRGGFIGLAVGGAVLGLAIGARRLVAAVVAPAAGAMVALAALVPSMVVGHPPRPALAAAGLAAGLGLAAALANRPRAGAGVVLIALVVVAGAAAVTGAGDPARRSRLSLASPDRAQEAAAAVRVAAEHPVAGAGPGQVVLAWHDAGGRRLVAHYAHNEYLQTAAELGLVGVALVAVLAGAVIREVRRRRPLDAAGAAAVAGLAAVAAHSGTDFLWHIPAIPLVCAALVAVACPSRQGAHR